MKYKKLLLFIIPLTIVAGMTVSSLFRDSNDITVKDTDNTTGIEKSIFVEMSIEEMFGYADIVARGKVKKVSEPKEFMHNVGGEDKYIISRDYTFVVSEAFKGVEPGSEIVIRVPGGEIGKKIYKSDAEKPDLKHEQILFLKRYREDNSQDVTYCILGGPQGKYVIDGSKARSLVNEMELNALRTELKFLKEKFGDKIMLPPGFLN